MAIRSALLSKIGRHGWNKPFNFFDLAQSLNIIERMEKNIEKPLGVIDALYGGFELVFSRPWILLIPIAVDLFLWMGPRVTAAPVFQQFIAWVSASQPPNWTPEMAQGFESAKSAWLSKGDSFNVFSVIAIFALGMPTLMGLDVPNASFLKSQPRGYAIADGGSLAGLIALMVVLGILIGSIYLETIAWNVRREKSGAAAFVSQTLKSYVAVGALFVTEGLLITVLLIPFAISSVVVSLFNQEMAAFVLMLGIMLVIWAALYLLFSVFAIFVSGANLWQAIVSSVTVFRYNYWSALGLVCLVYVIGVGFQIIWQSFIGTAWGALGADIANAFLISSLIAALMLFYHDRITWLNRIREQIRQQRPTQ